MSLFWSNVFKLSIALITHYSNSSQANNDKYDTLLEKFNGSEDTDEYFASHSQDRPEGETKQEFEDKKRQLLILLDQAVMNKMKITKAFPEKLAKIGGNLVFHIFLISKERFGLSWHAGWKDPPLFVPEMDCDPYRGACSQTSCPCDLFVSWPKDETYVYDPDKINPEIELCANCHHVKKYHILESKSSKWSLKEFSLDNMDKYGIKINEDLPPKHPTDIPENDLIKWYQSHPDYPGASESAGKTLRIEIEEDKKSLADIDDDDFDEDEEL